jgi:hypothetical protein
VLTFSQNMFPFRLPSFSGLSRAKFQELTSSIVELRELSAQTEGVLGEVGGEVQKLYLARENLTEAVTTLKRLVQFSSKS